MVSCASRQSVNAYPQDVLLVNTILTSLKSTKKHLIDGAEEDNNNRHQFIQVVYVRIQKKCQKHCCKNGPKTNCMSNMPWDLRGTQMKNTTASWRR